MARNKYNSSFCLQGEKDGYVQIAKIFERPLRRRSTRKIWFRLLNGGID